MRTAIVLFTRDLRLHDNPALSKAAHEAKRIVPLFVFDDAILRTSFPRPNRVAFLLDALRDLDVSLTSRGGRLVLRSGDVVAETLALAREVGAEAVFVAEDASAYAQRRQRRFEHACRGDRIALRATPGVTVAPLQTIRTGSGEHYSVFTPFYRAWSSAFRRPVESAPRRLSMPTGVSRGRLPALTRIVAGSSSPELPPGGETAGRRKLAAWLHSGVEMRPYDDERYLKWYSEFQNLIHEYLDTEGNTRDGLEAILQSIRSARSNGVSLRSPESHLTSVLAEIPTSSARICKAPISVVARNPRSG